MRIGALTISLLMMLSLCPASAQDWIVRPNTCIVEKQGESCDMQINIRFPAPLNGPHCLYLDRQVIQCWDTMPDQFTFPLRYASGMTLTLKDKQDKSVLTANLSVKVVIRERRRIRAPWSFF